jgi:hypothetical protein
MNFSSHGAGFGILSVTTRKALNGSLGNSVPASFIAVCIHVEILVKIEK